MGNRRKILIAFFFITWFDLITTLGITQVSGDSMDNTLADGNYYLYANKNVAGIERFDVALVQSETLDKYIIKRVVGLPGERVRMSGDNLYINGEKMEQDFDYIPQDEDFNVVLGDDEYFVIGDNRPVSIDSRYIGAIKEDEIKNVLINKSY